MKCSRDYYLLFSPAVSNSRTAVSKTFQGQSVCECVSQTHAYQTQKTSHVHTLILWRLAADVYTHAGSMAMNANHQVRERGCKSTWTVWMKVCHYSWTGASDAADLAIIIYSCCAWSPCLSVQHLYSNCAWSTRLIMHRLLFCYVKKLLFALFAGL